MLNESRKWSSARWHSARRLRAGSGKPARGFTLIELMIAIAIVAILAALAIPAINNNATGSEANILLGTVQFARGVAIKNAQTVVVCPSITVTAASPTCAASTAWATGWIVLVPANGLCTATGGATGDLVVQSQAAFSTTDTATFSSLSPTATNQAFCFSRVGYLNGSGYSGIIQIDTKTINTKKRRCLAVSGVGHFQVLTSGQTDINNAACP